MNGLHLGEMEASEMLDVLHVLFEEDFTSLVSAEQVDAKTRVRKVIYQDFYNKKYTHGTSKDDYLYDESLDKNIDYSDIKPFDPKEATRKPFIPATVVDADSVKPFGKNIDTPLG